MTRTKLTYRIKHRWEKSGFRYLCLEEEPQDRLILQGKTLYSIWTPWTYSIIQVQPGSVYPIISELWMTPTKARLDTVLTAAPLPNMYGRRPCYYYNGLVTKDLKANIVTTLLSFWAAGGNGDGPIAHHPIYIASGARGRAAYVRWWERKRPDQVLAFPWETKPGEHFGNGHVLSARLRERLGVHDTD